MELGVHALPIDLSSTNPLPDIEAGGLSYEAMAGGGMPYAEGGAVYGRLWNPTVARFESALARLEHTEAAVAFSSGMAAMTAAILATTRETGREMGRRHIVAVRPLYGGTDHLLASGVLGAEATFCTAEGVAAALRPDTALVILETPANPTLELADIRAVVEASEGVPVLVDNTFATPILQNPADFGASMVLHSATKYLGGHGDVIAGVIAGDREWAAALRRVRAITGALLHPFGAYLLHRGLATLPIRIRTQQANAQRVAAWLSTHPSVSRIHYPGISGDSRGLLGRQMKGTGAMISVDLSGGLDQARRLTSAVRLFTHAVSLGGVDSLIQHPAALTHRPVVQEARPSPGLVRLSIGLEDPEDLIADLDQALGQALTEIPAQALTTTRHPAPAAG
ncbi:cystathionine gamma-synthase [Sphaerimonospora thailandensis]|uniref:homocysteine desulfhydrase n=1 Tax=Sphaerimonospora thailandensis TaxID=795644 RepID=A0A8J3RA56_9ACTN|nr:cystathionine gamma-synthase [Sphaerimonospora thailandensis]